MDNSAITAKIRSAIRHNAALKTFQISVTTGDGMVTLTGAVDSQASVTRASELARNHYSLHHDLIVDEHGTAACPPLVLRCD